MILEALCLAGSKLWLTHRMKLLITEQGSGMAPCTNSITEEQLHAAMLATGMVLIIVSRRTFDLSIGSLLAFLGIFGAFLQAEVLPLEGTHTWWLSILAMVLAGIAAGAIQGWMAARFALPAFLVTLGGLMFWRGAGWLFTQGRTVAPLDTTFSIFGGGSIGEHWSWVVGVIGFVLISLLILWKRSNRSKLGFGSSHWASSWVSCSRLAY